MLFNSQKCYFMHAWQVDIYRSFTNNAVKLNDFSVQSMQLYSYNTVVHY